MVSDITTDHHHTERNTAKYTYTAAEKKIQSKLAPGSIDELYYCDQADVLQEKSAYWKITDCKDNKPKISWSQVIFGYKNIHVYCLNRNITIDNKNHTCPDTPFILSPSESFSVGNFNWTRDTIQTKQQYTFDVKEYALRYLDYDVPAFEVELVEMNDTPLKEVKLEARSETTYLFLIWLDKNWFSLIFLCILITTMVYLFCKSRIGAPPVYVPVAPPMQAPQMMSAF